MSLTREKAEDEPQSVERLGQASRARPEGPLLWVHAASPEDANAAPALAQELSRARGEDFNVLITTVENGTLTPAVANQAIHQLVPGETSGSVTRFLDHWRPDVGVFVGMPDRPNLIHMARHKNLPLYLTAPRRGSTGTRRRMSMLSTGLLREFNACLAASAADAEALKRHLDSEIKVEITGPLSDTTHALPCSDVERDATARVLKSRPVWLALEVSPAELPSVEKAHRQAFRFAHRLLLVIIPSGAGSGQEIAATLREKGWEVGLRSDGDEPDDAIQIFIADGSDERGLWFRLAPITFTGGTLDKDAPPADPFGPAALGSAVVHGPWLGAASVRFNKLDAEGASIEVPDGEVLGAAVQTLLAPDKAAERAQIGWQVTTEGAHAVERLVELINIALDEIELK